MRGEDASVDAKNEDVLGCRRGRRPLCIQAPKPQGDKDVEIPSVVRHAPHYKPAECGQQPSLEKAGMPIRIDPGNTRIE